MIYNPPMVTIQLFIHLRQSVARALRPVILGMMLLVLFGLQFAGCKAGLRIKGSEPQDPRPAFVEHHPAEEEYRVWVLVPSLKVNVYPDLNSTQQPMLQFTGDRQRLDEGWGSMAMLVAPDRFKDGERITFFEDKVLWSDRLRAGDSRRFTLWLRENNRSAPTRFDKKLAKLDRVAEAVEELSALGGFKIPARRAMNVSHQAFKELQLDWLILRWSCPWQHVLRAAREKLARSGKDAVMLRTRLVSREKIKGVPVAEVTLLFALQKLDQALPGGVSASRNPDLHKTP